MLNSHICLFKLNSFFFMLYIYIDEPIVEPHLNLIKKFEPELNLILAEPEPEPCDIAMHYFL